MYVLYLFYLTMDRKLWVCVSVNYFSWKRFKYMLVVWLNVFDCAKLLLILSLFCFGRLVNFNFVFYCMCFIWFVEVVIVVLVLFIFANVAAAIQYSWKKWKEKFTNYKQLNQNLVFLKKKITILIIRAFILNKLY